MRGSGTVGTKEGSGTGLTVHSSQSPFSLEFPQPAALAGALRLVSLVAGSLVRPGVLGTYLT